MSASDGKSELYERVAAHVDEEFVVSAITGALSIPSTSGEEEAVARYFAGLMEERGIAAELQPVPASPMMGPSFNTIGRVKGTGGGPSLLFNGHMDHNPVSDGWTKDPFGGVVEDGWIYGFVHMKAADACYIAALDAVMKAGIELKGDVSIALVCGELRGGAGTRHALKEGLTADYFILGEPTELQLATCHSASRVVKIHVLGRSKHFATEDAPDMRGVNAVEQAARVIRALGPSHSPIKPQAEGGFLSFEPRPGFEGLPQLNIGPIEGGIGRGYDKTRPALFPDVCSVTVDFRIIPGMTRDTLEADLARLLDGLKEDEPAFAYEIEFLKDTFPVPYDAPADSPVVQVIAEAHELEHGRPPEWSKILRFAASDAAVMQEAGITGLIYGPTGKYLSRPDEKCQVADFIAVTRTYAYAIAAFCGAQDEANRQ
jgi:acetylornithine deacetylase